MRYCSRSVHKEQLHLGWGGRKRFGGTSHHCLATIPLLQTLHEDPLVMMDCARKVACPSDSREESYATLVLRRKCRGNGANAHNICARSIVIDRRFLGELSTSACSCA